VEFLVDQLNALGGLQSPCGANTASSKSPGCLGRNKKKEARMEYVAIQSAITSGTALVQIFKGLASLKLETETLLKINDAQLKVSELLAALLGTQGIFQNSKGKTMTFAANLKPWSTGKK
jgi:hypothetical protein